VLVELLQYTLAEYNAADPDPVEWAAYVLIEICLGDVRAAFRRSNQFSNLSHPELERVRWAARLLAIGAGSAFPVDGGNQRRVSLHQVPVLSPGEWVEQLITTLSACGQNPLADAIKDGFGTSGNNAGKTLHSETVWQRLLAAVGVRSDGAAAFRRRFFYSKLRRRLAPLSRRIRHTSNKGPVPNA
jgi:hypothetical protein